MSSKPAHVVLRPAVPADCEIIAKMVYELAVYERAPEECHATPEAIREQLFGPRPTAECLVAEVGGEVGGYAIFFHNFSTWEAAPGLYLEDIYVRPTHRKKGVGKMLIEALAAIARQRGCKRYEWACLDWNKPARDFYESLGARPMTEWVLYRTEGEALDALAEAGREHLKRPEAPSPSPAPIVQADGTVVVHTDGGSSPNPGIGAWAAVLRTADGNVTELCEGELATTNNRMEMTAAIRALEATAPGTKVELHTDSQYLRNGITTWIKNWKRNGWKSKTGAVKNKDLWIKLDALCAERSVDWRWLQGHAGHEDNERCDALCTERIKQLRESHSEAEVAAALEHARAEGVIS